MGQKYNIDVWSTTKRLYEAPPQSWVKHHYEARWSTTTKPGEAPLRSQVKHHYKTNKNVDIKLSVHDAFLE